MPSDPAAPTIMPVPQTLTVLRALRRDNVNGGYVPTTMAKTLVRRASGNLEAVFQDEGKPYYVRGHEQPFTDFDSFATLLSQAVGADAAVIHGEIIPGTDTTRMRRLTVAQDDTPATIRDRPCPYIVLDIDKLLLPDGVSVQYDADAVISAARDALPDELRDVSFWFHHSHSAGTTPYVKLHLAFMLAEPMSCRNLDRWVRFINEREGVSLFDAAPYSPNDFIFVGNPILSPGVADPVPAGKRFGVVRGSQDAAQLTLAPTWRPEGQRNNLGQQSDIRAITGVGFTGVAGALKRLGAECHGAIVDAVKAAFRERELLVDDEALAVRIERAIEQTDWDYAVRPDDTIAREVESIPRVIAWRRRVEEDAIKRTGFGIDPVWWTP